MAKKTKDSTNEKKAFRIIALSDLHVTRYTGLFDQEAFVFGWERISDIINKRENGESIPIIINGDITDTGTYDDYLFAKSMLTKAISANEIKNEIFYLPGNHDERNVGYETYEKFFGERSFLKENKELEYIILGLDSAIPDSNSGEIGRRGREEIEKLALYPDSYTKIVCFHHHLLPIPQTGRERGTILDSGDILGSLFFAGIDVVITSHKHNCHSRVISNGKKNIVLINTGTFSCRKTRGAIGHTFVELEMVGDEVVNVFPIGFEKYSPFYDAGVIHQRYRKHYFPQIDTMDEPQIMITQISDTHFTTGSEFLDEIYNKGVDLINSSDTDVVIHCGDVTNNSYLPEFKIAKRRLKMIKKQLVILPGHRDLQPLGIKEFVKRIGPLDPIFVNELVYFQGINSNKGSDHTGHIGRSRLTMLDHTIEQERWTNRLMVVGMHHSLVPIPQSQFKTLIEDSGEVLHFIEGSRIPLVLSGHEHFASALQVGDTVFSNCSTLSSRKIKSQYGNTFNEILIYKNGIMKIDEVEIESGEKHELGIFQTRYRCL